MCKKTPRHGKGGAGQSGGLDSAKSYHDVQIGSSFPPFRQVSFPFVVPAIAHGAVGARYVSSLHPVSEGT